MIEKVCVRIPSKRREELMGIAKLWREMDRDMDKDLEARAPGWDAKAISRIARQHFGGLKEMFEFHGWPERGTKMMPAQQKRVADHYGTIEEFIRRFPLDGDDNES